MADRRSPAAALVAIALAVVVGAGGLLAGCTSDTVAGSASPGADVTSDLPSPPQQISLAGLDPCSMLTPAQRANLGVYAGVFGPRDATLGNSTACEFIWSDNTPGAAYLVAVASSTGIGELSDPVSAQFTRRVTVGGFPALDITSTQSLARGCATAVGTATNQLFKVSLELPPPRMDRKSTCAATEGVAAAVLSTVRAVRQK